MSAKGIQELMEQEIEMLKRLLALAQDKKEAILHNDLEKLTQIVKAEEAELTAVNSFVEKNYPQLAQASACSPLDQEKEVLVRQIKELNNLNQQLLEDSLALVKYSLRVLHGDEDNNLYGATGNVESAGNKSVINWRG
ncbi:MAG: flagellar protein FlgN [Firmicutes bacterium]|nr:flagellar protein FlgN [Bacillota bacterium]